MGMPEEKSHRSKMHEALELLNDAAKEKREELQGMLTDRYSHIKETLSEEANKAKSMTHDVLVEGEKRLKEASIKVDSRVKKDPWPYVAGTAAVALLIGYLMGSKRK